MSHKSLKTRREFLQMGTAALAGAALSAQGACSSSTDDGPPKRGKIVKRTLGRTGIELSVVSMGSAYAIDLTSPVLDAGNTYIQTSSSYS